LYAAMPPETPRTTFTTVQARPDGTRGSGEVRGRLVGLLRDQQALVDLAQGHRQRLLLHVGLDERADVLQQALAELRVVGVDLAGALGRVDHQGVLRVRCLQQVVD